MLDFLDKASVTIEINGVEVIALKKLSLVSHVLAQKLGGSAGREQAVLATTLDDLIRRVELAAIK